MEYSSAAAGQSLQHIFYWSLRPNWAVKLGIICLVARLWVSRWTSWNSFNSPDNTGPYAGLFAGPAVLLFSPRPNELNVNTTMRLKRGAAALDWAASWQLQHRNDTARTSIQFRRGLIEINDVLQDLININIAINSPAQLEWWLTGERFGNFWMK